MKWAMFRFGVGPTRMKWAMFALGVGDHVPVPPRSDVLNTLAAFSALDENARTEHGVRVPTEVAVQNESVEPRTIC